MKLIFTTGKTPFSKMIRWAFGADCSHFAIVFTSPAGGLMFESNLLGTHPKFYTSAKKHMTVVNEFELVLTTKHEDEVWDTIVSQYDAKSYDYPGFFYFMWRGALYKFFGKPLPKKNVLGKAGMHLCVAVFDVVRAYLPKSVKEKLTGVDLEITPPHVLRDMLKGLLTEKGDA